MLQNITKTVVIQPSNLGVNVKFYITDYIEKTYKHTLGTYGFIKRIDGVTQIHDGEITANGNGAVNYQVEFNVDVYKLSEGQLVTASISKITTFGIYCKDIDDTNDISTLFIPKNEFEGLNKFKEKDIVDLIISATRVKNNEYLCVCALKQ
jgi:DNA-directed RNA polymerase subunit E'/Rpb7